MEPVKVADAVWIAAAQLQRERGRDADFTVKEVIERARRDKVLAGERPGIRAHVVAHAVARSVFGFGVARFALGLGESGSFPASIKTVAEWFPKKERALATGIFNSGTNVGAIVTPLVSRAK